MDRSHLEKVCAVILAAGKGTRMNKGEPSPKPKVLYEANDRPLISFSAEAIKQAGINNVVIVIGYMGELVRRYLDDEFNRQQQTSFIYATQEEPLGTGDAVKSALNSIPKHCTSIVVTYGDDFYDATDLRQLIEKHFHENNILTVMSAIIADPTGFGRIQRNKGEIKGIIEHKLATEEEKKINEVNTGMYVFNLDWLRGAIGKIERNETGEYFLTDLIKIAVGEGQKISSYQMQNTNHWLGINSPEQLNKASQKLKGIDVSY